MGHLDNGVLRHIILDIVKEKFESGISTSNWVLGHYTKNMPKCAVLEHCT